MRAHWASIWRIGLLMVLAVSAVVVVQVIAAQEGAPAPDPALAPAATLEATPAALDSCVYDVAYWRDHPETWRMNALLLGTQLYSWQELLQLFATPADTDFSAALAQELAAAKMNIAEGQTLNPNIGQVIFQADSLLNTFPGRVPLSVGAESAEQAQFVLLTDSLRQFNAAATGFDCILSLQATPESLANDTLLPAATPEVLVGDTVLQGEVEFINGNVIRVLGIDVRLDPAAPILGFLNLGTPVRVLGIMGTDGVVDALDIQVMNAIAPQVTPEVSFQSEAAAPAATPEVGAPAAPAPPAPNSTPEASAPGVPAPNSTPEVLAPAFTPEVDDDNSGMGSSDDDDDSDDDSDDDDDNSGMGSDDSDDDDNSGMG